MTGISFSPSDAHPRAALLLARTAQERTEPPAADTSELDSSSRGGDPSRAAQNPLLNMSHWQVANQSWGERCGPVQSEEAVEDHQDPDSIWQPRSEVPSNWNQSASTIHPSDSKEDTTFPIPHWQLQDAFDQSITLVNPYPNYMRKEIPFEAWVWHFCPDQNVDNLDNLYYCTPCTARFYAALDVVTGFFKTIHAIVLHIFHKLYNTEFHHVSRARKNYRDALWTGVKFSCRAVIDPGTAVLEASKRQSEPSGPPRIGSNASHYWKGTDACFLD